MWFIYFCCGKLFYFLNVPKFVHSPVDGHFGCFIFFAVTNNVDETIIVHLFWCTCAGISVGYICLGVELLRYKVDTSSALPDSAKLSAKWLVPAFTHTGICITFLVASHPAHTWYFQPFSSLQCMILLSQCGDCKRVSDPGVNEHF